MKTKKGGYRKTEVNNFIKIDPSIAALCLRVAWQHEKSVTKAARRLKISRRSFFRYANRLEALGFDVGRPSGTTNPGIDTVRS